MKLKGVFLFIFILSLPIFLEAQELKIQDVWKRLEENPTLMQRQLEVEIALEKVKLQKLNRLPSLTADGSLQRNLIAATTPVPAIAFDPNAAPGEILPLRFTTDWSSKIGGLAEWKIFDPLAQRDRKSSLLNLEKSQIELQKSLVDLKKMATQAYASVVISEQQLMGFQQDSSEYAQVVEILENRYEAGRVSLENLNSAKQEMERKSFQVLEARAILLENILELSRYIKMESDYSFSTDTEELIQILSQEKNSNYDSDLTALDLEINDLEGIYLKRQIWPVLSLNAYYGGQYYSNEFDLWNGDQWYGNSYVSLGLKFPLNSLITQKRLINQNLKQRESFQYKLQEQVENEDLDQIQWSLKNEMFFNKIKSHERILLLAEQNKNLSQASYEAGRILFSDFNSAFNEYLRAKQNLLTVQFEFLQHLVQ